MVPQWGTADAAINSPSSHSSLLSFSQFGSCIPWCLLSHNIVYWFFANVGDPEGNSGNHNNNNNNDTIDEQTHTNPENSVQGSYIRGVGSINGASSDFFRRRLRALKHAPLGFVGGREVLQYDDKVPQALKPRGWDGLTPARLPCQWPKQVAPCDLAAKWRSTARARSWRITRGLASSVTLTIINRAA